MPSSFADWISDTKETMAFKVEFHTQNSPTPLRLTLNPRDIVGRKQ